MNVQSDAIAYCNEDINFMKAISFLSSEDIKKFYFLCLDSLPELTQCPHTAEEYFKLIKLDKMQLNNLLKELLFYTKKYKLLRILDTCRHQMETKLKNGSHFIEPGRLLLFKLCEDLKNSDINILKVFLCKESILQSPGWENIAAEDFFIVWLRKITKNKIKELRNALSTLKYDKLREFDIEFRDYFDKPYTLITPSPGKPCGLAVIFSFQRFDLHTEMIDKKKLKLQIPHLEPRYGTEKDEDILIRLWHRHGFDVLVFRDLISTDMVNVIDQLKDFQYNDYSIFLCCILTHGSRGVIYTSDNIPLDIYEDIAYKICVQALQEKPKLFFIQACQVKTNTYDTLSQLYNSNVASDAGNMDVPETYLHRHLMIAMSTSPLNMAFRQDMAGAWFVEEMNNIFSSSDTSSYDILELVKKVNNAVSERFGRLKSKVVTQTPELRATAMNPLYLKHLSTNLPIEKLTDINPNNCPLLYKLNYNFSVKPDIYLV